jgi:hypothetical protein
VELDLLLEAARVLEGVLLADELEPDHGLHLRGPVVVGQDLRERLLLELRVRRALVPAEAEPEHDDREEHGEEAPASAEPEPRRDPALLRRGRR